MMNYKQKIIDYIKQTHTHIYYIYYLYLLTTYNADLF